VKRNNPTVERLEREIAVLHKVIDDKSRDPGDLPVNGCGDHSCVVVRPTGMATNGGCRCQERELRRALTWYKRRAKFLEDTIAELKAEVARLHADNRQRVTDIGDKLLQ
jgi:hypothetical protein